ncbi:nucleotide exchange factor GrpE [Rubrobacter xylanophilus]|uniref:Protein GrpE n=1 Tax=Rubrobacter xylanophilus TaxID=49319 RepID=A0A510HE56_9ACTN|nr:nucleotide exchange factor GrpE [Rubrobacter xylanophilus]BBL78208.1 nucleotide exchange factor GrpE [Rubrobacter xylanophilus]
MSNEDRKERGPEEEPQAEEKVQEPQGSPGDPASVEEPAPAEVVGEEPPSPEEPASEDELAQLREELETIRRERDEYLNALRRLKAEFENSRKRMERETQRIREAAAERLVAELLPVLDNLDRALEAEGDIREGVRATRDQLTDVLAREGLTPIASDGQHFDPSVHEAVMSQPSEEHEEGTIIQTFERGYMFNGRPIRPAKVVVAT